MNKAAITIGLFLILCIPFVDAVKVALVEYTPNCGGFNEPKVCEAVYQVTNDQASELSISAESDLSFKYRTDKDMEIKQAAPNVQDVKTLYSIDGKEYFDDPRIIEKISTQTSFFVKNTLVKNWVSTGEGNEEYLESVDHIPSFFGVDYPEFAWYNSSLPYRVTIQYNNTNGVAYSPFVANMSFNTAVPIAAGKMLSNCNDLRVTWVNNTDASETEVPYYFYAKYSRFGSSVGGCNSPQTLMHGRLPYVYGNGENTSVRFYYGNPSTPEGSNLTKTYLFTEDWLNGYNVSKWYNGTGSSINTACANCVVNTGSYRVSGSGSAGWVYINNNTAIMNATYQNYSALLVLYKTVTTGATLRNIYAIDAGGAFTTHALTALPSSYTLLQMSWTLSRSYTRRLDTGALVETGFLDRFLAGGFWSQTSASSADFTNVTLVNWAPIPFDASNGTAGSEEVLSSGTTLIVVNDEILNTAIYFNATLTNSTNSLTTTNGISYSAASTALPQGAVTVSPINESYYPRNFYITITNESASYNFLLLSKSQPNVGLVSFYVVNSQGGFVSGALVSLYRNGNLISQGLTDGIGGFYDYLDKTQAYSIIVSASGYASTTYSIQPVESTYTLPIGNANIPTYEGDFDGIVQSLTPDLLNASSNWTIINYTIQALNGDLTKFGLNLSYQGVVIFTQENTNANGGTIAVNFSTENREGNVTALAFFQKSGGPQIYYKSYQIYNFTVMQNSLSDLAVDTQKSGGGTITMILLVAFFGLIIVSSITSRMPIAMGGGILMAAVLGVGMLFMFPFDSFAWIIFFPAMVIVGIVVAKIHSGT